MRGYKKFEFAPDEPWRDGMRVAHFQGLPLNRHYNLHVALYLQNEEVFSRPVSVRLDEDRAITVLITRSCADIVCPEVGGSAEQLACQGMRCVDPDCIDGSQESCPEPTCQRNEDCPAPRANCAQAECENGVCWVRIQQDMCSAEEYCNADHGCQPRAMLDSGTRDASTIDSAIDSGHQMDANLVDDGAMDSGTTDSGIPDAGIPDSGVPDAGPSLCERQTQIPTFECEALIALYTNTNGDEWSNNDGWSTSETPCSWYGVTCADGHVTVLSLFGKPTHRKPSR